MAGKPITLEELAAMYLSGGRNSGEKSKAKERKYYDDPAKHIKFERERKVKKAKKTGR